MQRRRSWVKEIGGAGSCNFPIDSWKFPTEIMAAQNFKFAPKFPQNWGFSAPNCVVLHKNVPTILQPKI